MSSEYALELTHGDETVTVHAADLYLLEQWDQNASVSDDTQRSAIFTRWLEIGWPGRLPYVERLETMHGDQGDLDDDEKDLLARVRDPSELQDVGSSRLVRTFYGDGSDEAFEEVTGEGEFDEPIFDNAALYDAGESEGPQLLHDILTRLPQIVEKTANFAHVYDDKETLSPGEAMAIRTDSEDWDYAVAISHRAAKWDHVLVYDQEANESEGNVLLVYMDDRGRVVRYARLMGTEELQAAGAMLLSGQDIEHRWWEEAQYGEDWTPEKLAERWEELGEEASEEED